MMDGKVLEGALQGSDLSNLSLEQLLSLLDECRVDGDSLNVLQAYLDRQHEGWREHYGEKDEGKGAGSPGVASGNLTRQQAYEVLGLDSGASREEIIDAHRKLIQKMHPDRGGSTYLAARINEAKDQLMGK
jgi:DnaJ-domain-containing protein 1